MKFQLLPIGARFEFEGTVYTKTGPLTAAADSGGQRMIPRHATLSPLDGHVPAPPPAPIRKLDEAAVRAAFEAFHGDCERLLDGQNGAELAAARQRFLEALGLL